MAQRKSLAWTELKVGLLVIAGFAILAYVILRIGGPSPLWGDKITITAYFPSANQLRPGNDAWLDGILVGKVTDVSMNHNPQAKGKVAVVMEIESRYKDNIRKDSTIGIESAGLLGDKILQITSGSETSDPVGDGGSIIGTDAGDIDRIIHGTN